MTSSAQLPIITQQRDISLGRWVIAAVVLFPLLFVGLLLVAEFLAHGTLSAIVGKALVLASGIGATVIPLLPELRALRVPFFARLWRVMRFVILIESVSMLVSLVWCLGDGPKSLAFLVHTLWFAHVVVYFYVLTHFDYLLSGEHPKYGGSDDDDWFQSRGMESTSPSGCACGSPSCYCIGSSGCFFHSDDD